MEEEETVSGSLKNDCKIPEGMERRGTQDDGVSPALKFYPQHKGFAGKSKLHIKQLENSSRSKRNEITKRKLDEDKNDKEEVKESKRKKAESWKMTKVRRELHEVEKKTLK
ncbi:hypothetical protein RUM43_000111 [Polyplax serrata]|uniref:Uncharacterized protein n=1 Tax=Polyplax serrata TaxID=468196 RepID=A0AAN8SBY3_POLSC